MHWTLRTQWRESKICLPHWRCCGSEIRCYSDLEKCTRTKKKVLEKTYSHLVARKREYRKKSQKKIVILWVVCVVFGKIHTSHTSRYLVLLDYEWYNHSYKTFVLFGFAIRKGSFDQNASTRFAANNWIFLHLN